jgi:hypothetical protein
MRKGKENILFAIVLLTAVCVGSLQAAPVQTEIADLQKRLAVTGISDADQYLVSMQLGQLLQLSGDHEEAARTYLAAASTGAGVSGALKEHARCRAAGCFIALGEMDRAYSAVQPITGANIQAAYLKAQIEAFSTGSTGGLVALLSDASSEPYRPTIYYLIAEVSGTASYRNRLINEYPYSPEASLLKTAAIHRAQTAFWFLHPGWNGITVKQSTAQEPVPTRLLQTGLYATEENARAMLRRLADAGFEFTTIVKRETNGKTYWAVCVLPSTNINTTIARLKEKGFESFPVLQAITD